MKLAGSDPDLETIYGRIKKKIYNLQPDFQRGEVWSLNKKKYLIDSILRGWHVPPIHIVANKSSELEVLDGQQRLTAIRDFIEEKFAIDGYLEPEEDSILELDGLLYSELPTIVKNNFNGYTIRIFTVSEYNIDEPAELFYRLNQPTNLTSAEKRNAFYGPIRDQIKEIKKLMDDCGFDKDFLGFSNSRMAYEDVISKVFYAVETGSMSEAISSSLIAKRFREPIPLDSILYNKVRDSIVFFSSLKNEITGSVKFNKATFFSWLMFLVQNTEKGNLKSKDFKLEFIKYIQIFENSRYQVKQGTFTNHKKPFHEFSDLPASHITQIFEVFNDRAGSRVANPSSVKLRDFIIWFLAIHHSIGNSMKIEKGILNQIKEVHSKIIKKTRPSAVEKILLESIAEHNWDGKI